MGQENRAANRLKDNQLRFLSILWCDNANVIRSKALHLPSLKSEITGSSRQ